MILSGSLFLKLHTPKIEIIYMPKKPLLRTLMDNQHVKGSETLFKS